MYLWTVDDRVVSMVGVGSPTPNGIGVAPVYTPRSSGQWLRDVAMDAPAFGRQPDLGDRKSVV